MMTKPPSNRHTTAQARVIMPTTPPERLNNDAIAQALSHLPNWHHVDNHIEKALTFNDFSILDIQYNFHINTLRSPIM